MASEQSGDGWTLSVEDNVVVGEFTDPDCFRNDVEAINRAFMDIVTDPSITSHVACVEFDDTVGDHMLEGAQRAAEKAAEHGIDRWAVAAPGIKQLAIKNNVDIDGLDVFTTEDRAEAMDWATE